MDTCLESFDKNPIPRKREDYINPVFLEAGVKEELKFMNVLYENVENGYLTENQGISMMQYVMEKMKTSDEIMEVLDDDVSIDRTLPSLVEFPFCGESVLPREEIVATLTGSSLYKPYTFERKFQEDSTLGEMMTEHADFLERLYDRYVTESSEDTIDPNCIEWFASNYPRRSLKGYLETAIDIASATNSLDPADGLIMKAFVEKAMMEFHIGAMSPIILPSGATISKSDNTQVEDDGTDNVSADSSVDEMVSVVDKQTSEEEAGLLKLSKKVFKENVNEIAEIYLRNSGWYMSEATVVYKNNITFDSIVHKLFDRLKQHLRLSIPENPEDSFKKCLNMRKDKYSFVFSNPDSVNKAEIASAITGCGFKPIKENNKILKYEKSSAGMTITVNFEDVNSGITVTYEGERNTPTKESAEDIGMYEMTASEYLSELKDIKKQWKDIRSWGEKTWHNSLDKDHPLYGKSLMDISIMKDNLERRRRDASNAYYSTPSSETEGSLIKVKAENIIKDIKDVSEKVAEKLPFGKNKKPIPVRENAEDTLFGILSQNPTDSVAKYTFSVLDKLYDESVTSDSLNESVKSLCSSLEDMWYNEFVCKEVLDNADFSQVYMKEASEKIDEEIQPVIVLLNRLGYKTKYSCAGHNRTHIKEDGKKDGVYHGKLYTTARITFDKKYELPNLPDGWYENNNSDKTSIYVRPFTYDEKDGTPEEAFTKWKTSYMKSIKEWAENLKEAESSPAKETE